jgi:aspartate/methionine/tyrosine aminotransferase
MSAFRLPLRPFRLERFCAEHEFKVRHVLSASDPESLALGELLALADEEARALWDGLRLGYTESPGHPLLRREIAGSYERIGPDEVLVAAPEEAILIAMQALLRPGDHAIVLCPAYQSLYEVAAGAGCEVTRWRLERGGSAWRLDLDALAAAITRRTRLLVVNFPHNPTGFLASAAEQATVVALAREHGLYLFSDEMYRGLEGPGAPQLPAACDLYERAVSLAGLSKSFGLPGLRIGWLATRDREALAACAGLKDYTTICASAPSEVLALIALRARERILARVLAIIGRNLAIADGFFAAHATLFRWLRPSAGTVAFPELLEGRVDDFCARLLAEQSVLLVPAGVFEYGGNHFRLGLGRADFAGGIERLDAFLREAPRG